MAKTEKKSILIYKDLIHTAKLLTKEQNGVLFIAILEYANGIEPTFEGSDKLLEIVFEPIKQQIIRDYKKWEDTCSKNSKNAKKRWSNNATANNRMQPHANHADNDNDTDTDNVSLKRVEEHDNNSKNIPYEKKHFLQNWNEIRTDCLKIKRELNQLNQVENNLFNSIRNNFKKEDFHKALNGLFKQEKVPREIMLLRPKHFLENIETYIDAENNNRYKLYANV